MFIKTGDGKITHIIESDEDLTEDQKEAVKKISQQEVSAKKTEDKVKSDN